MCDFDTSCGNLTGIVMILMAVAFGLGWRWGKKEGYRRRDPEDVLIKWQLGLEDPGSPEEAMAAFARRLLEQERQRLANAARIEVDSKKMEEERLRSTIVLLQSQLKSALEKNEDLKLRISAFGVHIPEEPR